MKEPKGLTALIGEQSDGPWLSHDPSLPRGAIELRWEVFPDGTTYPMLVHGPAIGWQ